MPPRQKVAVKSPFKNYSAEKRREDSLARARANRAEMIKRRRAAIPPALPEEPEPTSVFDGPMPSIDGVADAIVAGDEMMLTRMLKVATDHGDKSDMIGMIQALLARIGDRPRAVAEALGFLAARGYDWDIWQCGASERIPYLFQMDPEAGRFLLRMLTDQHRNDLLLTIARMPSWLEALNVDDENGIIALGNIASTSMGANAICELDSGLNILSLCHRSSAAAKAAINIMRNATVTTFLHKVAAGRTLKDISDNLESIDEDDEVGDDEYDNAMMGLDFIDAFYRASLGVAGDFIEVLRSQVSPDALWMRPALRDAIGSDRTFLKVEKDGYCEVERHGTVTLPEHIRSFRFNPRRCVLLHRDGGIVAWVQMRLEMEEGDVTIESVDLTDEDLDALADADMPIRETVELDGGLRGIWIAE